MGMALGCSFLGFSCSGGRFPFRKSEIPADLAKNNVFIHKSVAAPYSQGGNDQW